MELTGIDPFDALRGTRVPQWVRRTPRARQIAIQLRKRCPLDLSRALGIAHFPMAKALGAYLTAECRRDAVPDEDARALIDALLQRKDVARLGEGAWGYEFDVQTRWAFYPVGSPNLIATVFVARGLGAAGIVRDEPSLRSQLTTSAAFVSDRLLETAERPFFRYTLDTTRLVHNANLLGAGLVATGGTLCGDASLVDAAVACAHTTIAAQRDDGSWPYGEGASLGWTDNFHTAYNLDGLLQVWLATGDDAVRSSLKRGVAHWVRDFFGANGEPKYCPDRAYPYDIHSAGTAVDVAARLATWGFVTAMLAGRVAEWTRQNLVDPVTGATYYQKGRFATDRRHFIRWGDAHWALGTSSLGLMHAGRRDPLESAVAEVSGVVA